MPHRAGGHLISCACRVVCAETPCRDLCCSVDVLDRGQLFDVALVGVVGEGGPLLFPSSAPRPRPRG